VNVQSGARVSSRRRSRISRSPRSRRGTCATGSPCRSARRRSVDTAPRRRRLRRP
jgi:hypothetical protein